MKSNELRIGNWVQCDDGKSIVCGIEQDETFLNNGVQYRNDAIQPIQITEEWIERFGFEFDQNYGLFGFFDDDHAIYSLDTGGYQFHIFCCNDIDCWVKVDYVHELQNLYFALMGKELE
jgi:hypothetical protein